MPSSKNPSSLDPGPGLVPEDSVPEAALLFSTRPIVGSGSGSGSLASHLIDPIDAHDASAVSLNPDSGVYDDDNVQQALNELGSVVPLMNELGGEDADSANSGAPAWVMTREVGAFRQSSAGGGFGLALDATVETYNVVEDSTDIVVSGILYPADRGVFGLLRIDPDGTEVDLGIKVDLTAQFVEGTRDTGQVDYDDNNPGDYRLQLQKRLPVLASYSGGEYSGYPVDWTQYQVATFTITLEWGSASFVQAASYRLLHVEDGEAFATASTQYGISVPTPGAVPVSPENVLLRERVWKNSATAVTVTAGDPQANPTVTGTPPNRVPSSGVYGYGSGDTFTVSVASQAANNAFNTGVDIAGDVTLPGGSDVLEFDLDDFGSSLGPLAFDETSEGYAAADAPDTVEDFSLAGTVVTVGSATTNVNASRDAQFNVTVDRPDSSLVFPHATPATTIICTDHDTTPDSTRNAEERFGRDEPYRYPQDDTMNSVVALAAAGGYPATVVIDSGPATVADALQVNFGALTWPQTDYTAGHYPTDDQPDYSGFAADPDGTTRYYQRYFQPSSWSRRGVVEITGVDLSDFGADPDEPFQDDFWTRLLGGSVLTANDMATRLGPVLVLLKVPGVTNWMDLGAPRGTGSYALDRPGIGCLTQDLGSGRYEFDLGTPPEASSDVSSLPIVAVRVYFFRDTAGDVLLKEINRIAFTT